MTMSYADSLQTLKQAKTHHQVFRIAEHTLLYFFSPVARSAKGNKRNWRRWSKLKFAESSTSLENC